MYDPIKPYKGEILSLIKKTWGSPYVKLESNTYPIILKKKFSSPEVQHTDGVGTKGFYHWQKRTFKNAVQDALAMNLNDLAMVGATPYALQNHIVLPQDDHPAILKIIGELSHECQKRKIAMTGGETSIHDDAKSLDISITISGFIKKIRPNRFRAGDWLVGFKSHGLHSNGFTKIREVFGNKFNPEFVKPTTIYLDTILGLLNKYQINGLTHITGGAFAKLKDLLKNCDAIIDHTKKLQPHPIFQDLYQKIKSNKTMYSTFNCGIGFVISVSPRDAGLITSRNKNTAIIGEVVKGTGRVKIRSAFDNKATIL